MKVQKREHSRVLFLLGILALAILSPALFLGMSGESENRFDRNVPVQKIFPRNFFVEIHFGGKSEMVSHHGPVFGNNSNMEKIGTKDENGRWINVVLTMVDENHCQFETYLDDVVVGRSTVLVEPGDVFILDVGTNVVTKRSSLP